MCNASLAPDQQTLALNISWWDFTNAEQLLPSDSITIQALTRVGSVEGKSVTFYSSVLTINETGFSEITDVRFVLRGCSVNVLYSEIRGETVTRVYQRAINVTKFVAIRGQ